MIEDFARMSCFGEVPRRQIADGEADVPDTSTMLGSTVMGENVMGYEADESQIGSR